MHLFSFNTLHCNSSIYMKTMQAILTIEVMIYSLHVVITRKYLRCGNILGKLKHTTTWDQQREVMKHWSEFYYAYLGFNLPNKVLYVACLCPNSWISGYKGDSECIFFTLNTDKATFITDVLVYTSRNIKFHRQTTMVAPLQVAVDYSRNFYGSKNVFLFDYTLV